MSSFLRIIIIFLLFLAQATGFAYAQQQTEDPKLAIAQLTGDYYIYTTWRMMGKDRVPSNGLYVLTDRGTVMIDTPWDTTQFQPLLDSIARRHGQQVALCLSTHSHADRTAGLEYYAQKGIATWSTAQTFALCHATGEKQAERTFVKDTVFRVGKLTFETYYPGSGHTKDNIVVWFGDAGILYGGCFIKSTESPGLGYTAEADLEEWERSIGRTKRKYPGAKWVIPGHYGWKSSLGMDHTLQLLKAHKDHR